MKSLAQMLPSRFERAAAALLLTVCVGGIGTGARQHQHQRQAARTLRARHTERANLAAVRPALDLTSAAKLSEEAAATRAQLAERQARGMVAAPELNEALAVELAALAARLRTAADEASVQLLPHERFGFGEFAQDAPPEALRPALAREMTLVEEGVRCVLAARPRSLVGVQRLRAVEPVDGDSPGGLARVRLMFAGDTRVLQTLVNSFSRQAATGLRVSSVDVAREGDSGVLRCTVTVERRFAPPGVALALPDSAADSEASLDPWPTSAGDRALFGEPNAAVEQSRRTPTEPAVPSPASVAPPTQRIEILGTTERDGVLRVVLRDRVSGAVATLAAGEADPTLAVQVERLESVGWGAAPEVLLRELPASPPTAELRTPLPETFPPRNVRMENSP